MDSTQPTARRVKVLAFGDSLTEGYHSHGLKFHPYAKRLQQLLVETVGAQAVVDQYGHSGESTETMGARMAKVFERAGNDYTHVVLLGGTNDLFGGDMDVVCNDLRQMYEFIASKAAFALAVTVPEMGIEKSFENVVHQRHQLNSFIAQYVADHAHNMALVDLARKQPMISASSADRERWWESDGIHMKPAGYDHFAELIFAELKKHL